SPSVTPQVARWRIYEVLDSPLVEPLGYEPVVLDGVTHKQWLQPSSAWFDDPAALDRPLADDGPSGWAHSDAARAASLPEKAPPRRRRLRGEDAAGAGGDGDDAPGEPAGPTEEEPAPLLA